MGAPSLIIQIQLATIFPIETGLEQLYTLSLYNGGGGTPIRYSRYFVNYPHGLQQKSSSFLFYHVPSLEVAR